MDKTLKNIINKTIEREYQRFAELDYADAIKRSPIEAEYQNKCSEKINTIMQKLVEILPKEHQHLVDEFEDAAVGLLSVEARVSFKEGIIHGATDLNYLGEIGIELQCI